MAEIKDLKGRLGFSTRDSALLSLGVTQAADLLEEWGHPVNQIDARARNQIRLDSDEYRINLRLRRRPLRANVTLPERLMPPTVFLDVHLHPAHPLLRDQELDDLLLAVLLQRLTQRLAPSVVYWQSETKAMLSEDFLRTFDAAPANGISTLEPFEDAEYATQAMPEFCDADAEPVLFAASSRIACRDGDSITLDVIEDHGAKTEVAPAELLETQVIPPVDDILDGLAPIGHLQADTALPTAPAAEHLVGASPERPDSKAVFHDVDDIASDLDHQFKEHVAAARQSLMGSYTAQPVRLRSRFGRLGAWLRTAVTPKSKPEATHSAGRRLQRVVSIAVAFVLLQSSGMVQAAGQLLVITP